MSIKSTIRFKNSKNDSRISAAQKIIDREIDSYAQRFKTALTKVTLQIAKESVMEWYSGSGLSTGAEVASAIRVESSFLRKTKGTKTIHVRGCFDEARLDAITSHYESAIRWNAKHSDICDYTPGTYIFLLRWDLGVTALPERATATDTGWVNEHFQCSSLGSLKDFLALSMKVGIKNKAADVMRGRNYGMGAGSKSSNRTGLANLRH